MEHVPVEVWQSGRPAARRARRVRTRSAVPTPPTSAKMGDAPGRPVVPMSVRPVRRVSAACHKETWGLSASTMCARHAHAAQRSALHPTSAVTTTSAYVPDTKHTRKLLIFRKATTYAVPRPSSMTQPSRRRH
eukprot:scaffold218181_cov36-Tisochrysis_lutea.AAC.1